jgi:hypothetical protein
MISACTLNANALLQALQHIRAAAKAAPVLAFVDHRRELCHHAPDGTMLTAARQLPMSAPQ